MRPLEYLNARKNDIILNSTKDNKLSQEKANTVFFRIEKMIKLLSQYRINEYETRNLLKEILLTKIGFENIEDSLVINWLIKTIKIDDTYVYAYNQMAQWENRKAEAVLYPIKEIDELNLIIKIEDDKKSRIQPIKMASLIEIISRVQKQLDQLEHLIHGVNPTTDFDEMNWKALYTDIYLKFVHISFTKKGYKRLIQLKNKCEYLFNQLKDINDYSELVTKEFDVTTKITIKSKGLEFKNGNKGFTPQIRSLYKDFYLRLVEVIEFYQGKFADKELQNTLPPPQTNTKEPEYQENSIRIKIESAFDFMQRTCPRKQMIILNEQDYANLIDWITFYYDNSLQIPAITTPIINVNTNKTFVQLAFRYFFKEQHPNSTFPDSLFELYKAAFYPYRFDKKRNFFSAKNNSEVKQLMNIY